MTIVLILLSALAAFFAVVLIRTARFRPKAEPDASLPPLAEAPDAALAAEHLAEMIRIRTVSFADKAQEDPEPFEAVSQRAQRLQVRTSGPAQPAVPLARQNSGRPDGPDGAL